MNKHQNLNLSLPFISYSEHSGYILHREATTLIDKLSQSSPCSIISIVGKSKTGKSYLLNKLIPKLGNNQMEELNFFPVNDGIGIGTKGIRIMTLHQEGSNIILLDMEGLGNLTSNASSQGKLFALALLLSSTMIYNNLGPLDLQSLQGLGILIEISKLLGNSLKDNQKKLQMPSLIIALRDFALTLENSQGKMISSNQYLEKALQQQNGVSSQISNKNQIKKIIKDIFKQRECFTFSLPSEELPISLKSPLRTQFESQLSDFEVKIKRSIQNNRKRLNGKEITKSEWLSFAQSLVQTVNHQEKQGQSIRLQGLLFQAYRRQQGSIRDRFFMMIQISLKKAEAKYQQYMSLNQIFSQIDQKELVQSADRGTIELKKIEKQIEHAYLLACRQIEQMVRKQSGTFVTKSEIDYNHPSVSKIKDFSQLYHRKQEKIKEIIQMQQNISNVTLEQLKKYKQLKSEKLQAQKFENIMQEIRLCQSEKEADQKYLKFVSNLREEGTNLESKVFEANLLKLEVVYLRRKLECSERDKMNFPILASKQLSTKKHQQHILTEKNQNIFMTNKKSENKTDPQSHNSKLFTFVSRDITPFSSKGNFEQTKKSFLVPYLTIPQDKINIQIIRTLVKEDNRGSQYFQYVLEMVLNDKRWVFNRRWKDFNELHNILNQLFPEEMLPEFTPGKMTSKDQLVTKKEDIEIRRGQLEQYLRYLLDVGSIRNSRIMQKFLKINKEYVPYL